MCSLAVGKIKDAGGSLARHSNAGRDVHVCSPMLDEADAVRHLDTRCCQKLVQHCTVPYDTVIMVDSAYYIPEPYIVTAIRNGKRVLAAFHHYDAVPSFPHTIIRKDPRSCTVTVDGNGYTYKHKLMMLHNPRFNWTVIHQYGSYVICLANTAKHAEYAPPRQQLVIKIQNELAMWALYQERNEKLRDVLAMRYSSIAAKVGLDVASSIQHAPSIINNALLTNVDAECQDVTINRAHQFSSIHYTSRWYDFRRRTARIARHVWLQYVYTIALTAQMITNLAAHVTRITTWVTRRKPRLLKCIFTPLVSPPVLPLNDVTQELASIGGRACISTHPPLPSALTSLRHALDSIKITKRVVDDRLMDVYRELWLNKYPLHQRLRIKRAAKKNFRADVNMFLKIEKLLKPTVPRAIQARHDAYKYVLGPYIAQIENDLSNRGILCKGLTPRELGARYEVMIEKFTDPVVVEIDYNRFDAHVSLEMLRLEHDVYKKYFDIGELLQYQEKNHCSTRSHLKYDITGTRMSGDMNTSCGNGLLNWAMTTAVGGGIKFEQMVEGDDSVIVCERKDAGTFNTDRYSCFGMSPVIKISEVDEASFCSGIFLHTTAGRVLTRHVGRLLRKCPYVIEPFNSDPCDVVRNYVALANHMPIAGAYLRAVATSMKITLNEIPTYTLNERTRLQFAQCYKIPPHQQEIYETTICAQIAERGHAAENPLPIGRHLSLLWDQLQGGDLSPEQNLLEFNLHSQMTGFWCVMKSRGALLEQRQQAPSPSRQVNPNAHGSISTDLCMSPTDLSDHSLSDGNLPSALQPMVPLPSALTIMRKRRPRHRRLRASALGPLTTSALAGSVE